MSINGVTCHPPKIPNPFAASQKGSAAHRLFISNLSFDRRSVRPLQFEPLNNRKWGNAPVDGGRIAKKSRRYVSASFGDMSQDYSIFPRINVKDPYKRLGISREASQEEIQAARNYLINKYAGHKPSVDAIESAHDKIIMQAFFERKNPKINLNKKFKEASESWVFKFISSRFETPSEKVMLKNAIAFVALGVLTVLFPSEEGPTFQVAISLGLTIYFLYQRLNSRLWAFLNGVASFFAAWMVGTFIMVSLPPLPFLRGARSLEVSTSLLSYIFLWIASTYLK
ncbi:Protein CHAPERONE-LIKE PROTEIN OF POR1 [Carex littledalei]|uniref:Protein CHAPERONE-LIKE PROTEIN OF POR1 n=1 Tax=Carex littledalei TaxID=544730 RepID=A0A833QQQ0_9POAL|nr:Protein CHAPERONE-LIKE PROTEIN OF POR1 [Carex littledalei]